MSALKMSVNICQKNDGDVLLAAALAGDFDPMSVVGEEAAPITLSQCLAWYAWIGNVVDDICARTIKIASITKNADRINVYSMYAMACKLEQRTLKDQIDRGVVAGRIHRDVVDGLTRLGQMVDLFRQVVEEDYALLEPYNLAVKNYLTVETVAEHLAGHLGGGEAMYARYKALVDVCEARRIEVRVLLLTGVDTTAEMGRYQEAIHALQQAVIPEWRRVESYARAADKFRDVCSTYRALKQPTPKYLALEGVCGRILDQVRSRLFTESPYPPGYYEPEVDQFARIVLDLSHDGDLATAFG